MIHLLSAIAAVSAYLISGINPAIILSKCVYGKDIRECGSGNPGFTNFKRTFGSLGWLVMVLDLLKSALPCLVFGLIFDCIYSEWQLGVALTCAFSMLGHAFPVWYGFKGGKGFLVCLSAMWIFHPLAGLTATAVMVILLLTVKIMSLATMFGLLSALAVIPLVGIDRLAAYLIMCACVLFMIIRHKENIVRLVKGTESTFLIFGKKPDSSSEDEKEEKEDKEKAEIS